MKDAKEADDALVKANELANKEFKASQDKAAKAALVQKEPEDFSADEKEAAAAVISDKRAADVAKSQKTLIADIIAKTKAK